MKGFIWLFLLGSAFAQIPCPSNEILNLPPDGPSAAPKACVNTSLPVTKSAVAISLLSTLPATLKCGTTVSLKPGKVRFRDTAEVFSGELADSQVVRQGSRSRSALRARNGIPDSNVRPHHGRIV